ncbi:MAG: hypothetical protein QOJ89_2787 [bacterium]
MGTERARVRCRDRLERLAEGTLDSESVRREAIAALRAAIGFERFCVPLVDPDTLIAYGGVADSDHISELGRLQLADARLDEPNSGWRLARGGARVGRLSNATRGDLARSKRWRNSLERFGTGDELRGLAVDERGAWGRFDLWRDRDDRPFDEDDEQLLREVSPLLGRALRRAGTGARAPAAGPPPPAGVLLVDAHARVLANTPAIPRWLELLNPGRVPYAGGIPSLVWTVAGRAAAAAAGEDPDRPPRLRVRAADGRWAVVEAAPLERGDGIAITMHAASAREVLELVCRAHGLTAREREVAELIAEGLDTAQIAARLVVSRYTVQDHLKAIFAKTGAGSRLELLTGVLAQAG